MNAKALEGVSRVFFFNPHRLFLPQKKEKIIIERAKILARTKTLSKRVSRTKANEKVFPRESARDSLCVGVVLAFGRRVLVRKLFERDNSERERTKEFHLCVVVKTERRFRRTHIGSEKKTKIRETL